MKELKIVNNGIEIQIRDYEGTGSAVLFLHYGGGNLMMWQGVIPFFQKKHRLILLDLRGHGRSSKPATGYHIDDMAGDVQNVIQQLQPGPVHLVGCSMGAEVGLSLAAHYPEQTASLVCDGAFYSEYGPYGGWEESETEFNEMVAQQLTEIHNATDPIFDSVAEFVANRRQLLEKYNLWDPQFEAIFTYDACQQTDGPGYTRSWQKAAREGYFKHYFNYRFEDYYRRVQCPLLVLAPKDELENPKAAKIMQQVVQLVPDGRLVPAPAATQHPYGWIQDPAGMSEIVLKFLQEVDNENR